MSPCRVKHIGKQVGRASGHQTAPLINHVEMANKVLQVLLDLCYKLGSVMAIYSYKKVISRQKCNERQEYVHSRTNSGASG